MKSCDFIITSYDWSNFILFYLDSRAYILDLCIQEFLQIPNFNALGCNLLFSYTSFSELLWSNVLFPKTSIWQTHESYLYRQFHFGLFFLPWGRQAYFCWHLKIHISLNFANRFCKCLLKWQFFVQNYSTITHHNNSASAAEPPTPQKNLWKVLFYSGIILQKFLHCGKNQNVID